MSLSNIFNFLFGVHHRKVTISRAGNNGVVSGILPGTSVDLTSTFSAGAAWVNGIRVNFPETIQVFTDLTDTYLDLASNGVITYVEVANAAPAPALTVGTLRVSKVETDATAVTTVTQLYAPVLNNNYKITDLPIRVTPSNYFRNLAAPEEIVIEGREFVISKQNLDSVYFPAPKRGDRITDPDIGLSVISEVREMFDFGGAIIGYRIRSS